MRPADGARRIQDQGVQYHQLQKVDGEDARQAADLLDIRLTTRNIPGVGHVEMCGVPSHALDGYVEQLRAHFDVTISAAPEGSKERSVYTLRAFAQENDMSRYDIGYGAMGNSVTVWNRKETEHGDYKTIAHIDSDRKVKFYDDSLPDAIKEQIQRFADISEMTVSATQDASVFSVPPAGKEPILGTEPAAAPKPVTADEISDALIRWNGSFESKSRVNDYMLAHGRERGAAAWLKDEFGGADTFSIVTDYGTLELPWAKVQRQLGILVNDGRFFTEADRMLAQAEQIAVQSAVAPYERFTVIETDEGYGIWDDLHDGLYVDEDGVMADFDSEWVAENYLLELKEKIAQREAAEWEYVERSKYEAQTEENDAADVQPGIASPEKAEPAEMESVPHFQDDNDLIGAELTLDGRRFAVEEVRDGRASLRDITFQDGTGFPIFRNEPVETVRGILFPEKTTVPQVNLEAELTEAELAIMRPQLDAAGIDYLVANAGYNRRTISFSSQHYREVQDMLDGKTVLNIRIRPMETCLERYLDAKRSVLLFSKGVILVEGDGEEILIPALIKKGLGVTLDELGIGLINVGSVAFEYIASVFSEKRLQRYCAIITDSDSTVTGSKKSGSRAEELGVTRKSKFDKLFEKNQYVKVSYAPHTLEIDFYNEPVNRQYIKAIINEYYSDKNTIKKHTEAIDGSEVSRYDSVTTVLSGIGKGWHATMVAAMMDSTVSIPAYILNAISFAAQEVLTPAVLKKITLYILSTYEGTDNLINALKNSYGDKDILGCIYEAIDNIDNVNLRCLISEWEELSCDECTPD